MGCFVTEVSAGGSGGEGDNFGDWFGPAQVDQSIRNAIHFCWMALPKSKRTVEELEKEIRRIVDRALRDFREDKEAFTDQPPQ